MSTASTLDLRAELVDAAIAIDQTLRANSESRFGSPAHHREAHFDWVSRSAKWNHHPAWHGTSEIANNLFGSQSNKVNDSRFHRDADDGAVNEELLDKLFSEGGAGEGQTVWPNCKQ